MSNKEALIRLFHKLDESGDGIISCDELYSGLSKAGVSSTVIKVSNSSICIETLHLSTNV